MLAPPTTHDPKAIRAAVLLDAAMSEAGHPEVVITAVGPYDEDPDNSVSLGHPNGTRANPPDDHLVAWRRAWSMVRQHLDLKG